MNPDKHSFFRGAALTADRFAAVAYVDAEEYPDDPSNTMVLTEFDAASGTWTSNTISETRIDSLAAYRADDGDYGRALSTLGAVYETSTGAVVGQIEPLHGTLFHSLSANDKDMVAVGTGGHFYRSQNGQDFGLITDEFLTTPPDFDAPIDDHLAYMKAQFLTFSSALDARGRLGLATDKGIKVLGTDGNMAEERLAKIMVGATWNAEVGSFWFCGHSPQPRIWAGDVDRGFAEVFRGAQGSALFTSITLGLGRIWVGDNSARGDIWSAPIAAPANLAPITDLPEAYGAQPVWQVTVLDDVLWALRSKDLLRLSDAGWERFEPSN